MKNCIVRQSPITRDTLLIADADTKVKRAKTFIGMFHATVAQ